MAHDTNFSHRRVRHPLRFPPEKRLALARHNDRILDWLADHVLASMLMFDIALIVPLIAIPLSDSVKITLGVISGSWIQWWALPALQRSQVKADCKREAKADADHEALTHIAITVDAILARVEALESKESSA
jgi:predicted MFS family arabinose efflux permease